MYVPIATFQFHEYPLATSCDYTIYGNQSDDSEKGSPSNTTVFVELYLPAPLACTTRSGILSLSK